MAGTQLIGGNVLDAVRNVMTCEPDYLIMGLSTVTFYGGMAGADAFQKKIEAEAGIGTTYRPGGKRARQSPSSAATAALSLKSPAADGVGRAQVGDPMVLGWAAAGTPVQGRNAGHRSLFPASRGERSPTPDFVVG